MSKIFSLLMIVSLSAMSLLSSLPALAAGQVVTVTPSTATISTAVSTSLAFTTSSVVPVGGTISTAYTTADYTGTATMTVAGATGTTSTTVAGAKTITTFTVTTTAIAAGARTVTIAGLTTAATPSNSAWEVYTSAGDYGAAFQYIGRANVVNVRARVPLILNFAIRNAADTANTNICDMGDLSLVAIGNCEYRLKVATNAKSGYTINVETSGNFTNGTDVFANALAGATGTNIVAGTETYGAFITKGSVTGAGGATTLATAYDAGATNYVNYVNTTAAALITSNKRNAPIATDLVNTSLVRHEATINANTPAGLYTQTVTYTVAPSF
jgi:hypothetical protein